MIDSVRRPGTRCGNGEYETVSGGESVDDPYPDQ
jgi:hypothetical protein